MLTRNPFSGDYDGLQGVGQLVHVEHLYPLQLGHPVQIVVRGKNGRLHGAGQLHQPGVHLHAIDTHVEHLEGHDVVFPQTRQHLQAPAAAVAAERVAGVAIWRNSSKTNRGTNREPSRKPVMLTSAMRPSIMALVSTRMLPFLVEGRWLSELAGGPGAGKTPLMSHCRCVPSQRPIPPKTTLIRMGTAQPGQPSMVYSGIDTSDATMRPTNRPTMAAARLGPGNDEMYPTLARQGLRIIYGAEAPPSTTPARVKARPQGMNC